MTADGSQTGENDLRISDMGPDGNPAFKTFGAEVLYIASLDEYLVVWRGDDDRDFGSGPLADDEMEIFGQWLDGSTGGALGEEDFRLSDMGNNDGDPTFDADRVAVAAHSSDGTLLVVWQGDDEIGTLVPDEVEILGRQFANPRAADLAITKSVAPDLALPGQTITYTLIFSNNGPNPVSGVIITDIVPISLTNVSVVSSGVAITNTGASPPYVWAVQALTVSQGGLVAVSGQLSPCLPAGTFINIATITSYAKDTSAGNNSASVEMAIGNGPPVAVDDAGTITEDGWLILDVLVNDSDVNCDPLSVSAVSPPGDGIVAISGTTQIIYTPSLNFNGADSFTYDASDGYLTGTATVFLSVTAVNDSPVAEDDNYDAIYETPLDVPVATGVLSNDLDVDGEPLTASVYLDPLNGIVDLSLDGSFIYTPAVGFAGDDTFTYVASDGVLADTAAVTITVLAPTDADLAMNKAVDDPTPGEGDTIVYALEVTDNGPADATGIWASDALPAGVSYLADDGAGAYDPASGAWDVGDLLAGGVATLHISATVDAGTAGTTITNTAIITAADQDDPVPGNDADEAIITVAEFPCNPVTGVDLTIVTIGTIYAGDTVDFSVDISPDDAGKPYTYTLYVDGQTAVYPMSSSDDPIEFSHTFPVTGTFSVEIHVWNCDMSEADAAVGSVEVTVYEPGVCVPLETISILGETAGYTGIEYTFDTEYTPAGASLPISYTWDGGGTGASSSRTFDVTGTYTLSVTATNCDGAQATGEHAIVITGAPPCVELTGVDLSLLTTGQITPGVQVDFSADLMPAGASLPFSYTIDYGDGSAPVNGSGSTDPFNFNYTYANTGTFTVEFWAWNCELTEPVSDTVQVEVSEPVPEGYDIYLPIVIKND